MHEEPKTASKTTQLEADAIVISGISGIYPHAENNLELSQNLYNKVDMVAKDHFSDIKHLELPEHCGRIKGLEKFDAQFFRVTPNQALSFEPVGRKLMEQAYAAMFDAGINPETMKGTKLGVFTGFAQSDIHSMSIYNLLIRNAFIISGTSKTMTANRISYWVDAKGPSYAIDVGCASSMASLQQACEAISNGKCVTALVCGVSYNSEPVLSLNMKRAGFLCPDGKTKCFDKNGDGYVRSEAVNVLFLQKAKDAKRIYAEVCHVNGTYSLSTADSSFLPIRNPNAIEKFLNEFYSKLDVSPEDIEYIEANATGISEADRCELEGISKIFGKKRSIKIGSIKSNLGHTDAASGTVSVTKICLAYNKGELPANLHYTEPLDVPAIKDGKLQIITDNTSFGRGYVAINNFSYSGASYHALLKGHFVPKDINRYATNLPQLVLVSGRNEEGVNKMLDAIENDTIDPEQIALLRDVFKFNIPGHTGRGFSLFDFKDGKTVSTKNFEYYSGTKRPVCFLYSGLGSQWAGMGKDLMNIPIFADAIHRCHKALIPKGLDLIDMITNTEGMDDIMHSLIGITAVQIGLTNVLTSIGIKPDILIGHSLGEIGCAYADACFTAEEAILVSYCRGYVSSQAKCNGKMAAVGLGYKKVQELIPADIDIACHNSSNSTTISGPAEEVDKFVSELKERNVFAKIVASSDCAFHSRYISKAGPKLLSLMKSLKIEPKRRSGKWFSSCYMPEQWKNEASHYASPEYFTHNLLNTVLFEEAANHIPQDAIVVEVAPYGLMQSIIKKSHINCLYLPLTRRNYDNNINILFEAIGKLYQNGLNPDVSVLYPKVDFPVSTETPGLSHLVQWDHTTEWPNIYKHTANKYTASYAEYVLSTHDADFKFIKDYVRNGVNVYPESSLLVLVWKTLAMYNDTNYEELSVKFNDVKFYEDVVINSWEVLILSVSIQKGSNMFEVTNQGKLISNGTIQIINNDHFPIHEIQIDEDELCLTKNEIYKFLSMQGFSFGPSIQSIEATNPSRNKAILKWNNNWSTFLDSVIQLNLLSELDNKPCKVKRISSLYIYATKHIDSLVYHKMNAGKYVYANRYTNEKILCGGIVCDSVIFEQLSYSLTPSKMFTQEFIPHFCNHPLNVSVAVHVNMQIVYENTPNDKLLVNFIELRGENIVSKKIKDELSRIFSFEIELKLTGVNDVNNANLNSGSDAVVCTDFKDDKVLQNMLIENLNEKSFIMLMEDKQEIERFVANYNIEFITRFKVQNLEIALLRKSRGTKYIKKPIKIISYDDFKLEIPKNDNDRFLILANNSESIPKSYKNVTKNLLKQGKTFSLVDVHEPTREPLLNDIFSVEQAVKGLTINVLRNKQWGGYYDIPFKLDVSVNNIELQEEKNDRLKFTNDSVQVYYFGLCMKNCKSVVLKENKKPCCGMDYSGIDNNGKRVMGCTPGEPITSSVPMDPNLIWPVPEHWSLEDAATVPLPYLHAYYCLVIRHRLSKSTVLVTEGASVLGQALISLCLSVRCRIFATVNSELEKTWLTKIYPQINEENIRLSVDTEFRDFIINSTNNKRCKVVINCSDGEIRQAAIACVGHNGTFLDVSENDMKENEPFFMSFLKEEKNYVSVKLSSLFNDYLLKDKKILQFAIAEGIAKGIVKPLLRVVSSGDFTYKPLEVLSMSPNFGRMLIKINIGSYYSQKIGESRLILHPKRVYIVIWDESEFGVEFTNRLIERGAKNVIIHTRQKALSGYYLAKSLSWTSVKIEISNENLNSIPGCNNLIERGMKMGEIDGIFILNSGVERNDNVDFIGSNLDIASRDITTLSYFVLLKLVTHNVSEDSVPEYERYFMERKKLGLPSLRIVFKLMELVYDNNYSLKTISTILDGFEKSLKCKNYDVLVTDQEECQNKNLKFAKQDIKAQVLEDKLKIFFNYIDSDEYQATEPIIYMKTLTRENDKDEIRLDPDDRKAIMISGFLGNYKKLSTVAERLKISAIGLQIPPDIDGSISELAESLLQYIKMRFRLKSKFYIVAYSFGVNIALEVTALLEKEGYHGIIFCLDSSPLALKHQLKAHLGHFTEAQLQNSIIQHTYTLLTGTTSQNLEDDLNRCEDWAQKIVAFINNIKEVVSHSHGYLKDVVNAIYKRILMAIEYEPNMKLISEIVLIKGRPDPKIDMLPDYDYDLSKFTSKPVKVINANSDHVSVPYDTQISDIINGMLEFELLELFANKNMCEVYF